MPAGHAAPNRVRTERLGRVTEATKPDAYAEWPDWAEYRAYVEPEGYALGTPVGFYTATAFSQFVRLALRAYMARHPYKSDWVKEIAAALAIGL